MQSPPGDLPTGTVTFLFTDIEGSTRLLQALGDAFAKIVEGHGQLLRAAITSHGGHELRTEGDSFFAVFGSASGGLAAAIDAQRAIAQYDWPQGVAPRVRMGLHTGEAALVGNEYVGLDVYRAARIAAAGHGGQVLLSASTAGLVERALPAGVSLRDLREHRLKDLLRPERLYQLVVDGLDNEFPPIRGLDATPNNLPLQLTSFVGRERVVDEGRRLLQLSRLLTLTGPGGTGKTRLSLELAARVADQFPHGVYFVALAPVGEAELVPSTIIQALGLQDAGTRPAQERLVDYLRDKRLLLVLDNFEHLLPAAPLVGELLRAAAELTVLATSRAALRVYGEREFPIPPLDLPDSAAASSAEVLSHYEAVRLFIDRALAAKPDFTVTNDNAPALAAICARLDGLPLAIELAAARIKLLPPRAMLVRLEHQLGLLSGGARDLPARQQTLRGAIAWSYDMLDEGHRRLLARFAVFAGGAAIEQVDTVVGSAADLAGIDVFDGLALLVDNSLVRQVELKGEPRFMLLFTIREFALERLADDPDSPNVHRRHAAAFLDLAEQAAGKLTGPAGKEWLDRLEMDLDNLRAAMDWAIAHDEVEVVLRLVSALWRFWHMRGHMVEGRERAERALLLPWIDGDQRIRLRALEAAGGLRYWEGMREPAHRWYAQALDLSRQLGDEALVANALYNLAFTVGPLGTIPAESRPLVHEALEHYRRLNDATGQAKSVWALAISYHASAEYSAARASVDEALAIFRVLDDRFSLGWALHVGGLADVQLGNLADARDRFEEGLLLFAEARDISGVVFLLEDTAELAVALGQRDRAIRLLGAATSLKGSSGIELSTIQNQSLGRGAVLLTTMDTASAAWLEGRAMTLEAAVAYALQSQDERAGVSDPC
ncbi:MAG TPA: adenylate/guanylate cyclase domain-containing protein [Chloroflexota bacterium]